MQTSETYSTQEPAPLPPMVDGVKQEILSLARHIDRDNWREQLAEIARIAEWCRVKKFIRWYVSEEENDGNNAE